MKFNKFVRQNSRTLLMVFMALLLVAFLIPQQFQRGGGADGRLNVKVGKAFGRDITTADLAQVQDEWKIYGAVRGLSEPPSQAFLQYYLMMEEARRAGIRVGRDEVKTWLQSLPDAENRIRYMQRVSRRSLDQICDVLARWRALELLHGLQSSAIAVSLPREEVAYRDQNQQAVARVIALDDRAFLSLVPEPTEEQLQAFFEECKGRTTAHTDDKLVYGYLLPDRVKIEYLTVDPQRVKSRITIQAVQVKRYFEENRSKYMKPSPLATQPAEGGQFPQVEMTFDEARDRAREDYRELRAVETAQRIVNDMYTEAHQPWSASTRGEDGFLTPPTSGIVPFDELQKRFASTYDIDYVQSPLSDRDQIRAMAGIGSASVPLGRQSMSMPELALRVKGILKDPNDGGPTLDLFEPAPVAFITKTNPATQERTNQQAYLFRDIQAAPSAPPDSLDPMRAKVIADWKLVQAHELARAKAEALAARAKEVGLPAAIEQDTELRDFLAAADQAATQPAASKPSAAPTRYAQDLTPFTPVKLTRLVALDRHLIGVPSFPKAVFKLADSPTTSEAAPHAITTVSAAGQHKWFVVQLDEVKPIYTGSFEAGLGQLAVTDQRKERDEFATEWTAAENVKERTSFQLEPGRESTPR